MKTALVAKAMVVFALVMVTGHTFDVPSAHAELFRRPIFGGGLFRRPIFGVRRPVFNRRFAPVNRSARPRGCCNVVKGNVKKNVIDLNNIERIPGFARLRKAGNAIVESDRFGRVNRIFVDRYGRLVGARDPETARHLREFYFKNLDKFRGKARNTVLRFLGANGGANSGLFGQLNAGIRDRGGLSMGVVPQAEDYKAFSPEQIRTAALSFLINTMSNSCSPFALSTGNINAAGDVNMNLDGFIDRKRLGIMLNENPYSCGDSRAPVRVDWMVTRSMSPETYYPAMGLSDNFDGLGRQLGIKTDQFNTRDFLGRKIDRILVKGTREKLETAVGVNPQRIIEVQSRFNSPGTSFYRSYDFVEHPDRGVEAESRNVLEQGINFTADASEMIFTKCNNFLGFYLADAKGNRARSAPAEIAISGSKSVVAPDQCLKCHANGFFGGVNQNFGKGDPYTDHFDDIAKLGSFHSQFFSRNAAYAARQIEDSRKFNAAKRATGAHLPTKEDPNMSLPILFDMAEEYRKPITVEQAAAELGTTNSAAFQALFQPLIKEGKIQRDDFEREFCRAKARLGLGGNAGFERFQEAILDRGNHGGVIRRRF